MIERASRQGRRVNFPDDAADRIRTMRAERKPWAAIAASFGVAVPTVKMFAAKNGIETGRQSPLPPDAVKQIGAMLDDGMTFMAIGAAFGVTWNIVRYFAVARGLYTPGKARRFTVDEDNYLRESYSSHVPVEDMAKKLERTPGTIHQRVLRLGLMEAGVRNASVTRLIKRYGREVLQNGATPDEAVANTRARIAEAKRAARTAAQAAKAARTKALVDDMNRKIACGMDRDDAIFEARAAGVPLATIGTELGVTRERIRQIHSNHAYRVNAHTHYI